MRRKLSGHWGGNDRIEKVYGQSLRSRKDKILEYILDGYKPGSDKEFNDRGQQTEISFLEKTFTTYRKESSPKHVENIDRHVNKEPLKNAKKILSEIHFNYDKKKLNCDIFYLLKKRRLQIPIKSLKRQSVRIVISPPFMELYLGKDQIFPFDLKNVLAQKQKCPFEEMRTEGIQRMPDVITLQPEHEVKFAEFRQDIPRTGVTVLETAEDEDFLFQDRYNYLPVGIQNKRNKTAFNFKKLTYIEPTYMKCLQKNLTNINHPERFINESDISENTKYFASNKCSIGKNIKSFLTGTPPSEFTKNKYGTFADDTKAMEALKVPSSDKLESILPSSEPSTISCARTYDSHVSPSTMGCNISGDKLYELDANRVRLKSYVTTGAKPEAKRTQRINTDASSTDDKDFNVKHKHLKSSMKRRLTEAFPDYTNDVSILTPSITKGLFKKKKRLIDNIWPKKAEIDSGIKTIDHREIREIHESRETLKERTLFISPGCESAITLISNASETDKNNQKFSRSKSILKRGKKSSLRLEVFDRIHKERFHARQSDPINDKNKEKEHILADLSLEDKFKHNMNRTSTPTKSNRLSTVQESKHILEMMFGGSVFRHGKDPKELHEASTSKLNSWEKGKEAESLKPDDRSSPMKKEGSNYSESVKSVAFENTTKLEPKKTEDKKTKSSMHYLPSSQCDELLSKENCATDVQAGSLNNNNGLEYKVLFPLFQAVSSRISSHENNTISPTARQEYGPGVADKNVPVQESDPMSSSLDGNNDNETLRSKFPPISTKRNRK